MFSQNLDWSVFARDSVTDMGSVNPGGTTLISLEWLNHRSLERLQTVIKGEYDDET